MSLLTSKFDILRGWPNGSACVEELTKSTTVVNVNHKAGTFVNVDADYTVADAAVVSNGLKLTALIIEGAEDKSSTASGTVTVLLGGGYVVRLENVTADGEMFNHAGLLVGSPVETEVSGINAAAGSVIGLCAAEANCIGFVLAVSKDANGIGTVAVYIR